MTDKPKIRILNVDDDEAGRYAVTRVLRQEGFDVKEAANGTDALRLATEVPDLIVLDVQLPDMSGFDVCREIKSNPATSLVPVLLLSATYQDDHSKVEGLESGADGYLTQPIEPPVLVAYIHALLRARKAEEGLVAGGREWESTFDAIGECIALLDRDGMIRRCNKKFSALMGKPMTDIIGRSFWEIVHGKTKPPKNCPILRMLKSGHRESETAHIGDRWYSVEVDPLTDKAGNLIGAIHIMNDITEHKRVDEALKASEEHSREQAARLKAVLDAAPVVIWIAHDRECRTITGNRFAYELSQVPEGTNMSKTGPRPDLVAHYRIFKDGMELAPEDMPIQRVAATGQELHDYGLEFVFDDGTVRSLMGSVFPLFDSKGKPNGAVAAFMDITDRKRAEEILQLSETRYRNLSENLELAVKEQVEKLRHAERLAAIGQMISVVAHEIKNPLQNIHFGIDSLKAIEQDEQKLEILKEIRYGTDLMNTIVADLLDYARAIRLELSPRPIRDIVVQALGLMGHRLQNISVHMDIDQREIVVDADKMTRVFVNLISNATDAMPNGGTLKISSECIEGDPEDALRICISDNGCGISEDLLEKVEEPFFTTKGKGIGLGISICKKIVETHGGRLGIKSKVNEGTTVEITLPLRSC